jgi:hypothetical protein
MASNQNLTQEGEHISDTTASYVNFSAFSLGKLQSSQCIYLREVLFGGFEYDQSQS